MTDEAQATQGQATQQAPEPPQAPAIDAKEAEEGKAFAILSYALSFIGLPFFLIPLIMRNNAFSLFHAKQCLILWLAGIAGSVVSSILIAVCIGAILFPAVGIFCLVLNIMGLINATKLQAKQLPLIGKWGEDWFRGITKVG
jgi:uncharacterized membrane protein